MTNKMSNLNAMTFTLKSIVSCERLGLNKSFQTICFDDGFSKACQYVTLNEKVYSGGFKYLSIKSTHYDLQKCIIWRKKSEKGRKNRRKLILILVLTKGN